MSTLYERLYAASAPNSKQPYWWRLKSKKPITFKEIKKLKEKSNANKI